MMSPSTNRGILYVSIAIVSHLLTNSKEVMSNYDILMLSGGALLTGLITLRAFIDQTPLGNDPQPVIVQNPKSDPVHTEESKPPVTQPQPYRGPLIP